MIFLVVPENISPIARWKKVENISILFSKVFVFQNEIKDVMLPIKTFYATLFIVTKLPTTIITKLPAIIVTKLPADRRV